MNSHRLKRQPDASFLAGRSTALLILFLSLTALMPVFPEENSAQALLEKMKGLLFSATDFFANIRLSADGAEQAADSGVEYYFFRRDPEKELLLLIKKPQALIGYGFVSRKDGLSLFNPACRCFSHSDAEGMRERSGFYFEDIDPVLLEALKLPAAVIQSADAPPRVSIVELALPARKSRFEHVRIYLGESLKLPLKLEYLNHKYETERTVFYLSFFEIEKKYFPRLIRIDDKDSPALFLEFGTPSLNPIPDFVFTKAYLEELSR